MPEKISFRRATTRDWEDVEVDRVADLKVRPGGYLRGHQVQLPDGRLLREHRVASRAHPDEGYLRIDNEILAGRRLHELAGGSGYPAELACLYGDYDDKASVADPFTLFEDYRGVPLSNAVSHLFPGDQTAVEIGLLAALCWLANAGLAHRSINPESVLWDGSQIQVVDFSQATVIGASRTAVSGPEGWVAKEQQPDQTYGTVTAGDDIWAAGRLIFYVRNHGENLQNRGQLEQGGLDQLLLNVFDPPEQRPSASELLRRWQRTNTAPRLRDNALLRDGKRRFLDTRDRKHPGAPIPPDLAALRAGPDAGAAPGAGAGPGADAAPAGPAASPPGPGEPSAMPAPAPVPSPQDGTSANQGGPDNGGRGWRTRRRRSDR